MVTDITKDKDLEQLVSKTVQKFGKIDVLVVNQKMGDVAGVKHPNFMTVYDKIMKGHLRSAAYLMQLAVPHLTRVNGTVIFISGILSMNPVRLSGFHKLKTRFRRSLYPTTHRGKYLKAQAP